MHRGKVRECLIWPGSAADDERYEPSFFAAVMMRAKQDPCDKRRKHGQSRTRWISRDLTIILEEIAPVYPAAMTQAVLERGVWVETLSSQQSNRVLETPQSRISENGPERKAVVRAPEFSKTSRTPCADFPYPMSPPQAKVSAISSHST